MTRAVFACVLAAVAASAETVVFAGRSFGAEPIPIVDKGQLIFLSSPNHIEVYDRNGLLRFHAPVADEADRPVAGLNSAAVDAEGNVAITAVLTTGRGSAGGIVILDPAGNRKRVLTTDRFRPTYVCFAPQGDLWVFGWQKDADDPSREDRKDYAQVWRFSRDGREAGKYLPRSEFPGWAAPFGPGRGFWRVQALQDRIGAFIYPNHSGLEPQWIEMGVDGKLIGRWAIGEMPNGGFAYTSDARLFSKAWRENGQVPMLRTFDRSTGAWVPIRHPENPEFARGLLLGSDGEDLVFASPWGNQLLRIPHSILDSPLELSAASGKP